jgi:hypothetical protein
MPWGTLPAGRGVPGRLPAALGVRGLHAGARLVTRTDVVENSFFLGITCARLRACEYLPRRLHAVSILRRTPQAVRLQVHASASTLS